MIVKHEYKDYEFWKFVKNNLPNTGGMLKIHFSYAPDEVCTSIRLYKKTKITNLSSLWSVSSDMVAIVSDNTVDLYDVEFLSWIKHLIVEYECLYLGNTITLRIWETPKQKFNDY